MQRLHMQRLLLVFFFFVSNRLTPFVVNILNSITTAKEVTVCFTRRVSRCYEVHVNTTKWVLAEILPEMFPINFGSHMLLEWIRESGNFCA